MDNEVSKKTRHLITVLLVCWIVIAVVRTVFNASKVYTQEKEILLLSDEEKREFAYRDLYILEKELKSFGSYPLMLFSRDGKVYFFLRYQMYPKKIFWSETETDFEKVKYILLYHPDDLGSLRKKLLKDQTIAEIDKKEIKKGNNIIAELYKLND